MSQSRSYGRPSKRATTHSQSKDDIGALEQEFSRLEKELKDWNKEYNSRVNSVKNTYDSSVHRAYRNHLAILYDILEKSKPEDTIKQEYGELVSAVQKEFVDYRKRNAKEGGNPTDTVRRIKSNAIRGKPEVIKKLNGTPEGTRSVENTKAKLSDLINQLESEIIKVDKQYSENTGNLYKQHKEIEDKLNKMNIPKVPPGTRAEAIELAHSRDLQKLLREAKDKNMWDQRRELLEK